MLDELLGHDANKSFLKASLASPTSMLFVGPEGVGKKTIALHWVGELLGESERVLAGKHADVHLIEPDGHSVKIDQVRVMLEGITDRPSSADHKVYIIDGVDTMTKSAANMLLKPLEEPPPATLFILVGEHAKKVIPTIRSRCQEIEFQPVSRDNILTFTKQFIEEDKQAAVIASLASGSFSLATKMIAGGFLSYRESAVEFLTRLSRETPGWIMGFLHNLDNPTEFFTVLKALACDLFSIRSGLPQSVANQDIYEQLIPLAGESYVGPLYDAVRRLASREHLVRSSFLFHLETELLILRYKK